MASYCAAPRTPAEQRTFAQIGSLDRFFTSANTAGQGSFNMACTPSTLDVFSTRLDGDYALDWPVLCALIPEMAAADPEGTALLLAEAMGSDLPTNPQQAEQVIDRLIREVRGATIGAGNLAGNLTTSAEIALRAAWKAQARLGFRALITGKATGSIKLSQYVTIESFRIGKGGDIRKGAAIKVRIRGMPTTMMHALPSPVVLKAGGQFGAMRVNPTNNRALVSAADIIVSTRRQSSTFLRMAGAKAVPGVLAFGPSAVIDLHDSTSWSDGRASVNWKGFAVKSAASQSGNAVGLAAGALVTAGAGLAFGVVVAGSLPVLVVAFGVGLVAQVAWNYFDQDKAASRWVENLVK